MKLLLYTPANSPRLRYICHFIFTEIMALDFFITDDKEKFNHYDGIKIKYTNEAMGAGHFTIGSCGLLFETNIREQETACFESNNYKAFFKTQSADLPFDILAASFYLISRYEEYLPHTKDMYGRYAHQNSLAFKEGFLQLPIINIWANHLIEILQNKFPGFDIHHLPFSYLPTYDIDMAYSYKHKGWLRNAGGFLKSPSLSRVKVLLGIDEDPFDCYNWLDELHDQNNLHPIYFFLLAEKNGRYDKNILPHKKAMRKLVQEHAKSYRGGTPFNLQPSTFNLIGIHPSWQSGDKPSLFLQEKKQLEVMSEMRITNSRQHYIRFNLPEGYRLLVDNGITDDYSMGYGSINGFRASVATSFYWYNLQKNEPTSLRVHPFCFMEANSFYEQKYTPAEAFKELMAYYLICKQTGGQLITIWHNNFLGTDPQIAEWRELYKQFIIQINT